MKKLFALWTSLILLVPVYAYINKFFNLKNDNIIEQTIENIIENEIGIKIDITP